MVQNTAWTNVEKALANFGGGLAPEQVERLPMEALVDIIRPSGFYNAKAACVKDLTAWWRQYGYSVEGVRRRPQAEIRRELLAIRGIGRETADAIMVYSFRFPAMVVDAYLKRLAGRLPLPTKLDYAGLQAYFEAGLPRDAELLGHYHILILEHGKRHCKKRPACTGCPLFEACGYPKAPHETGASPSAE